VPADSSEAPSSGLIGELEEEEGPSSLASVRWQGHGVEGEDWVTSSFVAVTTRLSSPVSNPQPLQGRVNPRCFQPGKRLEGDPAVARADWQRAAERTKDMQRRRPVSEVDSRRRQPFCTSGIRSQRYRFIIAMAGFSKRLGMLTAARGPLQHHGPRPMLHRSRPLLLGAGASKILF
jgi:hypothetical protein